MLFVLLRPVGFIGRCFNDSQTARAFLRDAKGLTFHRKEVIYDAKVFSHSEGPGGVLNEAKEAKSLVVSLTKGLRVLEAFTAENPELTVSQVAAAAGLDAGTAFRMLNTLVTAGYLSRREKLFRLTLKVADLGFHAIARSDLRDIARPILRNLVGETLEAASLGVIDAGDVLYVERVRAGISRLGVDIRIGTTVPAASSMIGHAMLAFMTAQEVEQVFNAPSRPGGASDITITRPELMARLEEVRRDGYVLRESLFTPGLRVLAVPVRDSDGHALAAISVVAPASRASEEDFRNRLIKPTTAAAADIGRAMQVSGSVRVAL